MDRKTLPIGKGWFIWQVLLTMGGDPEAIARVAYENGIEHLYFHIHSGSYNETRVSGGADLTPYIQAAVARGIQVWGWGAVWKDWWSQGCDRVIEAMKKHPELTGYILDAEAPIKNAPLEAAAIMRKLRGYLPTMPIGLSSYRFPRYHPELPWYEFRSQCDFDIPQVYWEQNTDPDGGGSQLEFSYNEFATMEPKLPYVATGCAYKVDDWRPTPDQVKSFLDKALELKLSGVDFWVWYQTQRDLPSVYELINNYKWETGVVVPPPPPPPVTPSDIKLTTRRYVNIRSTPTTILNNVVGGRDAGETVEVLEIHVLDAGSVWVRDSRGWSAIVHRGVQYML